MMDRGMRPSTGAFRARVRVLDEEHSRSGGPVGNDQTPSARHVEGQGAPEPGRLFTPEEEAGMDLAELEDPPQAEGQRLTEQEEQEQEVWRDRQRPSA